jgi:COP9 signalosome complex subunit 2
VSRHGLEQLSDESRSSHFQAQLHTVQLLYKLQQYEQMITRYEHLLTQIPAVTRNEASDAVDSILNTVGSSNQPQFLEKIYTITSQTLQNMPDTDRMVFNINLKLCKTYVEADDFRAAKETLNNLHVWCCTVDPVTGQLVDDRKNKGSELLEVYALEIRISAAQHDVAQMRHLYEATKDLSAAVKDPRSQSVIRECWGLMFSHDKQVWWCFWR